jgi:signal transduction histidine kinase
MTIDAGDLRALIAAGIREGGNEILALLESRLHASGNPVGTDPEMRLEYRAQARRVITEWTALIDDGAASGAPREPYQPPGGQPAGPGPGARVEPPAAAGTAAAATLDDLVRAAQEAERRRSAREIHDRIGNRISLAMRHLELYEIYRERDPNAAAAKIAGIRSVLEDLLESTRRLMSDLRLETPVSRPALALRRFVAAVDPAVAVDVTVHGEEELIPPEHRDELFVVLREALRNVFAHARARSATVVITVATDQVTALVEDDGAGFDPNCGRARSRRRSGLDSMRERIELLGGSWTITSRPARGTRVEIAIPFPRQEATP